MQHYGISINGVKVLSTRKIAIMEPEQAPVWMESVQDLRRSMNRGFEQEQGLVRASRLIINAAEMMQRIAYPLKQGNCVIKLLDHATFQLEEIKSSCLRFDNRKLLREIFENEQITEETQSAQDFGDSSESPPMIRQWNIKSSLNLLRRCKEQVLIEQICFIVERIRLSSFIGEVKANRYLTSRMGQSHGNIYSRQTIQPSYFGNQLCVPVTKAAAASSRNSRNSRDSCDMSKRHLSLYSELKNSFYKKDLNQKLNESRMFRDSNYTLMWDTTNKEYYSVLMPNKGPCRRSEDSSQFIGKLNTKLKVLKQVKESNSLQCSVVQNYLPIGLMCFMVLLGTLCCLMVEGPINLAVCLGLCCGGLLWSLLRFLTQEIYSKDSFRSTIKSELEQHFERGESAYIYEMLRNGYDIVAIKKKGYV